jgi:hypothetical protein
MRKLLIAGCAVAFAAAPAFAAPPCQGDRCPPNVVPMGQVIRRDCCGPAPSGWGWYRRQKYRADRAAPLVIIDELDAVTLVRGR